MADHRELGVPTMPGSFLSLTSTTQDDLHDRICEVRAACVRIEAKADRLEEAITRTEALNERLETALVPTMSSCFKKQRHA